MKILYGLWRKTIFFIIINMIHYQHIVFVTGSTIWKKGHHWNTNLKCLNHLKTEKHYHYRFQEFHLGFQKDPPPSTFINCSLLSLIQKLFLKRFSLKEFIIMLLNMTTVPLNNWGFTHKVKNHSNWNLTLILHTYSQTWCFFSPKYTKIQEIKDIKVKKETIIGTWNPCCLTKWLKNCLLLINKTHR